MGHIFTHDWVSFKVAYFRRLGKHFSGTKAIPRSPHQDRASQAESSELGARLACQGMARKPEWWELSNRERMAGKEVKEQQGQTIDYWGPGENLGFSWSEMESHCKFLSQIVA